jgi:hypothetical protein
MKRIIVLASALLALSGVSVMTATASSASVCQPDGTGCTKAGTYHGPNALINSNYGGFRLVWTESVVKPYSSGVPLYWNVWVTYTNIDSSTRTLSCPEDVGDLSAVQEHMSGGSGDDGTVGASATTCSDNPSWTVHVPPGGTAEVYSTFHNVPWPGSAVAITWYTAGTTAYVYPFVSSSTHSGEACVFDAPTGLTTVFGHEIFGHVGWGFRLPSGYWEFGANEGPRLEITDISKTWYATGTWHQMLTAFRHKGNYHSATYYTKYKCATVNTTNADIAKAGATVGREFNETYLIPGRDCESQVYNVLRAYGVKHLPSDTSIFYWPSPNNWFNHLSSAGFGSATKL